jgi:Icc-related predicted phosphoesterase
VLGNHDFEAGKADEVRNTMLNGGVVMLDGECHEFRGVGFAGAKGFAGGFGRFVLTPWGETAIKNFVTEAVNEALKLESALAKLAVETRIAMLHYSPVSATVEGESSEIFPFTGCSRLEEPLNRYQVLAAFHGHAHHGAPEGKTTADVPVFNVSMPVLKRVYPERSPYHLLEVEI